MPQAGSQIFTFTDEAGGSPPRSEPVGGRQMGAVNHISLWQLCKPFLSATEHALRAPWDPVNQEHECLATLVQTHIHYSVMSLPAGERDGRWEPCTHPKPLRHLRVAGQLLAA